ncbi:MAG TPA: AAA family ATPase [Planctomycetota bacterium]|nr:AAA family ATPase [Planctomycetota bacterium]HRR82478.1 AAA family ATPase [Planctomycetota bacterium]HRT94300.1 AAA family ATPase [Planctomycetota bacterium]
MATEATAAPAHAHLLATLCEGREKILREIRKVIIGQDAVVNDVVAAFFAGGHCLITGVPGLAKTLLISSLGRAMDLTFRRVQFTPDLMPADITGTEVLEEDRATGSRKLVFRPGPIFTNILLADEINRTPPKTQAALLEAMQEHQVTVSGSTYPLQEPFFVLATQNPIEQEGTYPLPEIQQDRFMFSLLIDYLPKAQEIEVIDATTSAAGAQPEVCMTGGELIEYQRLIRRIPVAEPVIAYAVSLAARSRPTEAGAPDFIRDYVSWGASIRASHYLVLGAKARAALAGRPHVSVQDVQSVAFPVLRHRIITNFRAESEGISSEEIIRRLLEAVSPPRSGL